MDLGRPPARTGADRSERPSRRPWDQLSWGGVRRSGVAPRQDVPHGIAEPDVAVVAGLPGSGVMKEIAVSGPDQDGGLCWPVEREACTVSEGEGRRSAEPGRWPDRCGTGRLLGPTRIFRRHERAASQVRHPGCAAVVAHVHRIPAAGVQPCDVGNVSSVPGAAKGRASTRWRPGPQPSKVSDVSEACQ
jgi:hypothetical protein